MSKQQNHDSVKSYNCRNVKKRAIIKREYQLLWKMAHYVPK